MLAVRLTAVAALWLVLAAATPVPLTAPPPDLTRLVTFVEAPLDKSRILIPEIPLPPPPAELPALPPAPLTWNAADRPIAQIPPVRGYPCVGALLPIASQALECGKDRFSKGEYAEAAKAFEWAIQRGADREFLQQARYWLGETLVKQGSIEEADVAFRQVSGDVVRTEWELWATHAGGWMALRRDDPARARAAFVRLLSGAVPSALQGWARHGLALAQYALGQYADADRLWTELSRRGVPPTLTRDFAFWYGEVAGRVDQHARAESELRRFVDSAGTHPLVDSARVRLGWWTLAAGRFPESAAALRAYLAGPRRPGAPAEGDFADAGLALALAGTGDWQAARDAARRLATRRSPLALPVSVRLARTALDAKRSADVQGIVQDALAGQLAPGVRAWLLLAKGDAERLEGNRDDARTQYDLARQAESGSALGQQAVMRLARTNFEMREFAQAVKDVSALLPTLQGGGLRLAALLLQGEAAYHGGNQRVAETAYRRALAEFPQDPQAPLVKLSLGWVALRQNQRDEARQAFLDFARTFSEHPSAADALELAAELAIATGDVDAARRELDQVVTGYPMHPRTDFSRLNRGILMVRLGQLAEAQGALRDWIARAPFQPLLGRAHAALGAALLAAGRPGEAAKQFAAAQREGVGAYATLGAGVVDMLERRPNEAARALGEAREQGTAEIAAAAEYALAALALQQGGLAAFKQPALGALRAAPSGPMAPRLLYVLTGIAVEEKDWPAALDHARTLATRFPDDETADDALERVGAGAEKAEAWPVVYDAYSLLRVRYPASPFLAAARVALAQAQLQTGRTDEARRELDRLVAGGGAAASDARTWILLARARELTGDRRGAIEAYARAARESKGSEWIREARFGEARLLAADRRWDQARAVLDRLLKTNEDSLVPEVAFTIGETYRQEGDPIAASEYYMTAAYLAPGSPFGRKALLAAAQVLAGAKYTDAAVILYKKVLAQADVPPDVADAARQGLRALGR